ncbi:MAG: hypothetical protein ACI35W_05665 [Anaeroplasmataceae bacterium]
MGLLKIGIFNIDYTLIILFFIGIAISAILFGIVFLILKLSTKNKNFMIKSKAKVSEETGKLILDEAISDYLEIMKTSDKSNFVVCKDVAFKLINDIALIFFPKSKSPVFELSIDELVKLVKTVGNNIEEKLNDGLITKALKGKLTIATIMGLTEKKSVVEESPIEKNKNKFWNSIGNAIKSGVNKAKASLTNFALKKFDIMNKVCILIIQIVGEETFKAFYLKVYNDESNIDVGIDETLEEIRNYTNENSVE